MKATSSPDFSVASPLRRHRPDCPSESHLRDNNRRRKLITAADHPTARAKPCSGFLARSRRSITKRADRSVAGEIGILMPGRAGQAMVSQLRAAVRWRAPRLRRKGIGASAARVTMGDASRVRLPATTPSTAVASPQAQRTERGQPETSCQHARHGCQWSTSII
jgi:hypothetical protein